MSDAFSIAVLPARAVVTGPPGSGKTGKILEIFNIARESGREKKCLLIVPDSIAREHIRDKLARTESLKAFTDTCIQTISSFVAGIAGSPDVDQLHLVLLIGEWIRDGKLNPEKYKILQTPGGIRSTARAVFNVRSHGYTGERIEREGIFSDLSPLPDTLKLWEKWLEDGNKFRDEARVIERAVDAARELAFEYVLIDGFTEFRPMHREFLEVIFERSSTVVITLDPSLMPSRKLLDDLVGTGFAEYRLQAESGREKSAQAWLSGIESWKFNTARMEIPPGMTGREISGFLKIIEAADARIEAATIAREAARWVSSGKGRTYSDIIIISPNLGEYHSLLETEFRRADIPLRCYADRALDSTSPGAALSGLLSLFSDGISDDLIIRFLGLHNSGIDREEIGRITKFVKSRRFLGTFDEWLKWADELGCEGIVDLIGNLRELSENDVPCAEFAESLIAIIEKGLRLSWKNIPDEILRDESWAWNKCCGAIRKTAGIIDEISPGITIEEVSGILGDELADARGRPLDRSLDSVNAITLLNARTWTSEVAIICGLSAANYPRLRSPDPLLPDNVRAKFNPPMPTSQEMYERELELFRIAVTRATKRLILTRPLNDSSGSPLRESIPLRVLQETLGGIAPGIVSRISTDPPVEPDKFVFPSDIAVSASRNGIADETLGQNLSKLEGRTIRLIGKYPEESKVKVRNSSAVVKSAMGLHGKYISATHINNLAQCRYKFFALRILKLSNFDSDRVREGLNAMLWGSIAHDALAGWHRSGRTADFEKLVRKSAEKILDGIPDDSVGEGTIRAIIRALARFREFEKKYLLKLGYKQEESELDFSERENSRHAPVKFKIDENREIKLGGVIDRVDYGFDDKALVIDYKRSDSGIKAKDILDGNNLQLACYIALVESALGRKVSMAAFVPIMKPVPISLARIVTGEFMSRAERAGIKFSAKRVAGTDPSEHLEKFRERMCEFADTLESGDITPKPLDIEMCGRNCDFGELCRYRFTGDEGIVTGDDE